MIRVDSSPLIASRLIVGDSGHGVLAEELSTDGYLYNDVSLPADNGKEIRGEITRAPTNGTLFLHEDGDIDYTGTTDYFEYQLYVDGIATGSPARVDLNMGSTVVSATLATIDVTTYAATINAEKNIDATLAGINVSTFAASITVDVNVTEVNASLASIDITGYTADIDSFEPTLDCYVYLQSQIVDADYLSSPIEPYTYITSSIDSAGKDIESPLYTEETNEIYLTSTIDGGVIYLESIICRCE